MAQTQTSVVNRALRKLGQSALKTDIDNTTDQNAIVMKDLYDDSLRILLACANWAFATKRAELSLTSDDVSMLWTKNNMIYVYDLPSDFITLIGWSEAFQNVRQEGAYLVSDSNGGMTTISVNENTTATPAWASGTGYTLGDFVLNDEYLYYCNATHSSSASDKPGTGASWETYWTLMTEISTGVWKTTISKKLGILYVYENTTIANFPPYFYEALACQLALDAQPRIKQTNVKQQELKESLDDALREAKARNSQGQTPLSARADAWINAKYSGADSYDHIGLYYR
jgi:hypothetical protein